MHLISSRTQLLRGETTLPGDKSLSHRAALFAALADGPSRIRNFLTAGVTGVMISSLSALGVETARRKNTLTVHGKGIGGFRVPETALDCGNSATTIRLLAGGLAAAGTAAALDGSAGLRSRPMNRIVQPLQQMGVPITATAAGTAPLGLGARSKDRPLKAIRYTLPVASAQIKSCLLLAALSADGETVLSEPGPSRDHTERMLRGMGVNVVSEHVDHQFATRISPVGKLDPIDFIVPGDMSSAAFLIVAALIVRDARITIHGVGLNPTRTGLIDVLLAMGADIKVAPRGEQCGEPIGDLVVCSSSLHGTHISGELVVRMIDEFPIFAVAAAFANGKTVVEDAGELRYKESDRIAAMCTELRAIGVKAREQPDGFVIQGGRRLPGGCVDPHGDHRLAMSLAVAGLVTQKPVIVPQAETINESFPGFVDTLAAFGAHFEMEP